MLFWSLKFLSFFAFPPASRIPFRPLLKMILSFNSVLEHEGWQKCIAGEELKKKNLFNVFLYPFKHGVFGDFESPDTGYVSVCLYGLTILPHPTETVS